MRCVAVGRLITVVEDPSGLNVTTTYGYDVLDDLFSVAQGSQARLFVHDSARRLTSAVNPESGTISYGYDSELRAVCDVCGAGKFSAGFLRQHAGG
jgi:hypothetical protein